MPDSLFRMPPDMLINRRYRLLKKKGSPMRKFLLSTAAAVVLASGSAMAADLPARVPAIAPAPVFVSMSWAGFYVGAQLGASFANDDAAAFVGGLPIVGAAAGISTTGLIGGVYAGYNWQFNSLVVGLEADANLASTSKTVNQLGTLVFAPGDSVRGKSEFEGALVAKVGVAFDRALLYALGGVTFANAKTSYNLPATLGFVGSNDTTRAGWTLGAGLAYKFAPNWSGRVEYRYSNYGNVTHILGATGVSVRHSIDTHRVMAGLTYHFGGPAGAVVAKY
jgi:outer membrane immunogenic protein